MSRDMNSRSEEEPAPEDSWGSVCIQCGEKEAKAGYLCLDCFLNKRKLFNIPEYVDLEICVKCGASRVSKRWYSFNTIDEAFYALYKEALVLEKNVSLLKMELYSQMKTPFIYLIKLMTELEVEDLTAQFETEHTTRIRRSVCPRCSRQYGNYYEAIIQIRTVRRTLLKEEITKVKNIIESELDRESESSRMSGAFITKVEEVQGGVDYYLGSAEDAKRISKILAEKLYARITETKTIAGRKEGVEIYRFTYSIRIPEYRPGDFIKGRWSSSPGFVERMDKRRVFLRDLNDNSRFSITHKEAEDAVKVADKSRIKKAVIVARRKGEADIMDPDDYKTITILIPAEIGQDACELNVIKIDERVWPVLFTF